MNLSKKAMEINPSVTLQITAKAKAMRKQGIDVITFAAGEPDFNTPDNIINAAVKAMNEGNTKYTESSGIVELRNAICEKLEKDNDLTYKPSQIVVSTGAKQCLANIFLSILNPGDEVILSNPAWVSYVELIKMADGVPLIVQGEKGSKYKYSINELEKRITSKTKAILINSPNNPTGHIYTKEELIQLADFAKKHNLLIISDEIYEKLIYDDKQHISIASLSQDAYERTIVVNGMSKTYAMTGWRIGYTASSERIAKIMTSIQSHMTSNPCSIAQYASLEALTGPQEDIYKMKSAFEERRNYMIDELDKMGNVSYIKPEGAFYIMVDISSCIGKSVKNRLINNSIDFAEMLLEEENVAVIPGIAFGLENYIRLSYATSMESIKEGLKRINHFINN